MKLRSYQLLIHLSRPVRLVIGRLGECGFPAGDYVYTGSAKRNLEARIARHLREGKKLHWHIDYLLASRHAEIIDVIHSSIPECELHQAASGRIPVPGFGATDCRAGCGSHLKLQRGHTKVC